MKNKIKVDVFVPTMNETYNLFIPVNTKIIYTNKEVVVISSGSFSSSNDY